MSFRYEPTGEYRTPLKGEFFRSHRNRPTVQAKYDYVRGAKHIMRRAVELDAYPPGMTLRDWFAGQALIGLLSGCSGAAFDRSATTAFRIADAMLKEQTATPEGGGE